MTQTLPTGPARPRPAFSIPSILAIIAAVVSLRLGAGLGLLCALVAIVLGLVGFFLALAPQTRGGIVSVLSILLGLIGIIAAIVRLVGGAL